LNESLQDIQIVFEQEINAVTSVVTLQFAAWQYVAGLEILSIPRTHELQQKRKVISFHFATR